MNWCFVKQISGRGDVPRLSKVPVISVVLIETRGLFPALRSSLDCDREQRRTVDPSVEISLNGLIKREQLLLVSTETHGAGHTGICKSHSGQLSGCSMAVVEESELYFDYGAADLLRRAGIGNNADEIRSTTLQWQR